MGALDGVSDSPVQERRERRVARHIHRERVNGVRDHVPQWNRGERKGEDHLLVFTARSWGLLFYYLWLVVPFWRKLVAAVGGRKSDWSSAHVWELMEAKK